VASRAAAQGYGRPTSSRHYTYLRASQKEPFDILDFTPAISLIANTSDHSWLLIPEIAYIGIKNIELRIRLTINHGNASTDYGEKPVRTRSELRARYYF